MGAALIEPGGQVLAAGRWQRDGADRYPQMVRDLLARRQDTSADSFAHTLDDLVIFAIRLQEQAGLDVVSDGEWRRHSCLPPRSRQ